jgi:hypothetical protein
MRKPYWAALPLIVLGAAVLAITPGVRSNNEVQPPEGPPGGPPPFGPGGPPPFGPGGFMGQKRKLVKQFDKNGDGRLNKDERQAAREFLHTQPAFGRRGGFGPPGGFGPFGGRGNQDPPKPGPHVTPAEVNSYPRAGLYEPTVLRTLFLEFENKDWEAELADFHGTDVEVPVTLTVDGKKYPNVGARFRGMSSYMMVRAGHKRSLNLALDFADKKQRLYGAKTLNLLNSHDDPTLMDTVLYSHIARQYIPAPKANFVKVVINGESWGVYVNAQQFDKEFLKENYRTTKGTRWKVKGSPGAAGGLDYIGDNTADYKRHYEMKSGDDAKAWQALIHLCKTLDQTPPDKLEAALAPLVDIDSLLWFLALDVALINGDGYWVRSSDYNIFRDGKGKFHFIPHDINEAFRPAGWPGFGMRPPQPGELLSPFLQDMLQLSGEQKKEVAALQKDVERKVEKLLTADQRAELKRMRQGGPGGPGGRGGRGPGGGFGGGAGGVELDPLVGLSNPRTPLRGKVLDVPRLKAKYLHCVRTIAERSLDWNNLGPVVAQYRSLIEKEVAADTRKLDSLEEFQKLTADVASAAGPTRRWGPPLLSLRAFADQRCKYLLNYPEIKKLAALN